MNKLWLVPIITFLVLSIGLIGGLVGPINTNTSEQIIINSAGFEESSMGFGTSYLNVHINATFLEDIESITITGILHKKDGSYNNVNFDGKPNNGLKNHDYLLNYTSSFMMDSNDIENLDYLELTIRTTNKEGNSEEIKLNITSTGQVTSNQGRAELSSKNQSNILNSIDTEDDEKSNSGKSNSENDSSSSGISASKAKSIASGYIEEGRVGTPYKSGDKWIVPILINGKQAGTIYINAQTGANEGGTGGSA